MINRDIIRCKVILLRSAEKSLRRLPKNLLAKFNLWLELVVIDGLRETRKIKSYHDEPLIGKRKGQRSIRLNKAYRAIYRELETGEIECIEILEVNKHEY